MTDINFRQHAREHIQKAKELLDQSGDACSRYACLEIRMAIEALTYQTLQAYISEVPNTVMTKWTPKQVMRELLEVDPAADKSKRLYVGKQEEKGTPAQTMKYVGDDKRFSISWANKTHNALGSFLHEMTISDYQKCQNKSHQRAREKAAESIAILEEILSSRIYNVNVGTFVELNCECGFLIKRKLSALTESDVVGCNSCGLFWVYEGIDESGRHRFQPDGFAYNCEACGEEGHIDAHIIHTLPIITCRCGVKAQVNISYKLEMISQKPVKKNTAHE